MSRQKIALAAVVIAMALPFLSKPWHMDEPMFFASAKHALQDLRHPLSFDFNWYGRVAPMKEINNNPPISTYVFAACLKASGGREAIARALLLPFDLIAALSLYGLAAFFLRRPFWPTLTVVVSPAYAINMSHLMAEKPLAAFVFPALYSCVRGIETKSDRWYWASAVLFSLALLTKYAGVFLLFPAVAFAFTRGMPMRKIAAHAVLSCVPLALYLLIAGLSGGRDGLGSITHVFFDISDQLYSSPLYRLRASLAFIGGCCLPPVVWSLTANRARPWKIAVCGALMSIMFLPIWDSLEITRGARVTGVVFACAALCALGGVAASRRAFWMAWTASGILLTFCYWSITTRTVMFLLPPLTFAAAESLEKLWERTRLDRLYLAGALASAALTVGLAAVDYRYARAQQDVADFVLRTYAAEGRSIWCGSHWGLQHYLVAGGARQLDWTRGGWDEAKPGDVVVVSRVNTNVLFPEKNTEVLTQKIHADSRIPLRLMSGWGGQAGFYSNMNGFLPFAFSREPLDEFWIAEIK